MRGLTSPVPETHCVDDQDRRAKLRETAIAAIKMADEALASPDVSEADKVVLGVSRQVLIDSYCRGLEVTDLLGRSSMPLVVDVWNSMIGMMNTCLTIGTIGYRIVGARTYVQGQQVQLMQKARAPAQQKARDKRRELLLRHITDVAKAKAHPSTTANAIFDAINQDLKARGEPPKTARTIQNWINELD